MKIWFLILTMFFLFSDLLGQESRKMIDPCETSPLEVTLSVIDAGCSTSSTGSIDITINSGTAPFTYLINPGGYTIPPFTNLPTHPYEVMVTDSNGCFYIDTVTVGYIDSVMPTAYFEIIDTCLIVGDSIHFNNLSTGASGYNWSFGNGDVSITEDPVTTFYDEGYHCITLTATNLCGSSTYSPDPLTYILPGTCSCDVVYNMSFETVIDTNVVWDPAYFNLTVLPYEIFVEGDIVVESGGDLAIQGLIVHFSANGRILVKEDAGLKISNSTLTSIENCGMWQGIEVWGYTNLPSTDPLQGVVVLDANVVIENAHIGVLLGKRDMNHICMLQNSWLLNPPFVNAKSGGVIETSNATMMNEFRRNGIDIKFTRKNNQEASMNVLKHTRFETPTGTALLDFHYNSLNGNSYPNDHNPWAGNANGLQRTCIGIDINGQKDINIHNCHFNYKEIGIKLIDARAKVYGVDNLNYSQFTNLKYGIYSDNTGSGVNYNKEVYYCYFDRIGNSGIYLRAGVADNVHENQFGTSTENPLISQANNNNAISSILSTNFQITDNDVYSFKSGLYVVTSDLGGGYAGSKIDPEGNRFITTKNDVMTIGYNPDLSLHCNTCHNDDYFNTGVYSLHWANKGTLANQGQNPVFFMLYADKKPAGNEFRPIDRKQINSIAGSYVYYHHDTTTNDFVKPHPLTTAITTYETWPSKIPASCIPLAVISPPELPTDLGTAPFSKLDSLADVSEILQNEYLQLENELDGGETWQLIEDIHNMNQGNLKNKLISHSPLSDTVLFVLMTENPLSPGNLKNVLEHNLPVSKNLEALFFELLDVLSPGISKQLYDLQGYNENTNTITQLDRLISAVNLERKLLLNEIMINMLDTGIYYRKNDVIALLEMEGSENANKLLVATYIQDGNFAMAGSKLSLIPADNPSNIDFIDYYSLVLDIYQSGRDFYQADSNEIAQIREIAWHCPENIAVANARAVLYMLFNELVEECPEIIETKNLAIKQIKDYIPGENEESMLGENYPDPFKEITQIPYSLPEGVTGMIRITDVYGRKINEYEVKGKGVLSVVMGNAVPGSYFYSLLINDKVVETRKMVVK